MGLKSGRPTNGEVWAVSPRALSFHDRRHAVTWRGRGAPVASADDAFDKGLSGLVDSAKHGLVDGPPSGARSTPHRGEIPGCRTETKASSGRAVRPPERETCEGLERLLAQVCALGVERQYEATSARDEQRDHGFAPSDASPAAVIAVGVQ